MKARARHAVWWTVALVLLVPALAAGFAVDAVKRIDMIATTWWYDFHDWAYQDARQGKPG
jgi:hypothetical protein